MFVYRTNGTRFDTNHVQIKDRSVRKSVPYELGFRPAVLGTPSISVDYGYGNEL
jgi:hypothetical protein